MLQVLRLSAPGLRDVSEGFIGPMGRDHLWGSEELFPILVQGSVSWRTAKPPVPRSTSLKLGLYSGAYGTCSGQIHRTHKTEQCSLLSVICHYQLIDYNNLHTNARC